MKKEEFCNHLFEIMKIHNDAWKCTECGLIIKKTIKMPLGIFINECEYFFGGEFCVIFNE